MHIGFNCVFIIPGETGGMEVYARELLRGLTAVEPNLRLTAFLSREAAAQMPGIPDGVDVVVVPVDPRRRVEWARGELQILPHLAERAGVDIMHSLANTGPVSGAYRRVLTVQDLAYRLAPRAHSVMRGLGMRVLVPLSVRRSHRIIAPSRSTAADVVRFLGKPTHVVDVVPHGPGQAPTPKMLPDDQIVARFGLVPGRPIVASLCVKRPHKNLGGLLRAIARVDPRPITVIAGHPTSHESELVALAHKLGIENDLRMTGSCSPGEIDGLCRLATAFVYPSLYEGFGLPVLEAMARGVPVACSDRGSLPEIAGDAALFFDPTDPAAIAHAIERLLRDPELRSQLSTSGRARAAAFSWEATARGTAAVYERALA